MARKLLVHRSRSVVFQVSPCFSIHIWNCLQNSFWLGILPLPFSIKRSMTLCAFAMLCQSDVAPLLVLLFSSQSSFGLHAASGIVASKIVDAFYRPTIVLSIEDGVAHGSCRSIPSFDMLAALESAAPLMLRFGGHKQAAGLQIEAARIREFRQAVNAWAEERLGPDDLRPRLWLDGPLAFSAITPTLMAELNTLAPFGAGNPRPIFQASPVEVVDGPRRLKDRHLKMSFRQEQKTFRAVAWNAAEREAAMTAHKSGLDLAYTLEENEWRGNRYLELRVEDFRGTDGA